MNNADHNADNLPDALSADDFVNIYSVNVVGAYQMTRAVAPHMKARGYGSIVNTSSIAGVMALEVRSPTPHRKVR